MIQNYEELPELHTHGHSTTTTATTTQPWACEAIDNNTTAHTHPKIWDIQSKTDHRFKSLRIVPN